MMDIMDFTVDNLTSYIAVTLTITLTKLCVIVENLNLKLFNLFHFFRFLSALYFTFLFEFCLSTNVLPPSSLINLVFIIVKLNICIVLFLKRGG